MQLQRNYWQGQDMKNNSSQNEWKCINCGACCKFFRIPPKNQEELYKQFKTKFGHGLKDYKIEITFEGTCEHLKNNKCLIYKNRPKRCKDFLCKRHTTLEIPKEQLYKKRCKVCKNIRSFQKGTDRDIQSICGNCWVW